MRFCNNKKGQGMVEYLIIVALIAVGTIGIMRVVGQSVNVKFAQIARSLGARSEGNIQAPSVSKNLYQRRDMANFMSGSLRGGSSRTEQSGQSEAGDRENQDNSDEGT